MEMKKRCAKFYSPKLLGSDIFAQTQRSNIEQLFKSSDSLKHKNHRLVLTFFEIFNMCTIYTESDKSSFYI